MFELSRVMTEEDEVSERNLEATASKLRKNERSTPPHLPIEGEGRGEGHLLHYLLSINNIHTLGCRLLTIG